MNQGDEKLNECERKKRMKGRGRKSEGERENGRKGKENKR